VAQIFQRYSKSHIMKKKNSVQPRDNNKELDDNKETGRHEHPLPGEISEEQKKKNAESLQQAEADMQQDPDFTPKPNKNEDLDEGELARLGENNDLV
jgi:hypothetical protein